MSKTGDHRIETMETVDGYPEPPPQSSSLKPGQWLGGWPDDDGAPPDWETWTVVLHGAEAGDLRDATAGDLDHIVASFAVPAAWWDGRKLYPLLIDCPTCGGTGGPPGHPCLTCVGVVSPGKLRNHELDWGWACFGDGDQFGQRCTGLLPHRGRGCGWRVVGVNRSS